MNTETLQPVIEVAHDKLNAASYAVAGFSGLWGLLTWEAWGVIASIIGVAVTVGTNVYVKLRQDRRKERESRAAIKADRAKEERYRSDIDQ